MSHEADITKTRQAQTINLHAFWHGERDAGINPGSEEISITLHNGGWSPSDIADLEEQMKEFFHEWFDGAKVLSAQECAAAMEVERKVEDQENNSTQGDI